MSTKRRKAEDLKEQRRKTFAALKAQPKGPIRIEAAPRDDDLLELDIDLEMLDAEASNLVERLEEINEPVGSALLDRLGATLKKGNETLPKQEELDEARWALEEFHGEHYAWEEEHGSWGDDEQEADEEDLDVSELDADGDQADEETVEPTPPREALDRLVRLSAALRSTGIRFAQFAEALRKVSAAWESTGLATLAEEADLVAARSWWLAAALRTLLEGGDRPELPPELQQPE